MIIQHNIMALNSYNRLSSNNTAVSKNLEKLSSGYKINRAGDDAAGLAISEKMRAQITGLTRASQNAQDGISLVQTAEGQLTEVHSMLNRMVDLATQASNGTYDGDVDRKNLQKEVTALKDEINRIAETSNFNGIKLLDGKLAANGAAVNETPVVSIPAQAATTGEFTVDLKDLLTTGGVPDGKEFVFGDIKLESDISGTGDDFTDFTKAMDGLAAAITTNNGEVTFGGVTYDATIADKTTGKVTLKAKTSGATTIDPDDIKTEVTLDSAEIDAGKIAVTNGKDQVVASFSKPKVELDYTGRTGKDLLGSSLTIGDKKYQFLKTGETADAGFTGVEISETSDAAAIATALQAKVNTDFSATYTVTATSGKLTIEKTNPPTAAEKAPAVEQKNLAGGLKLQIGDTAEASQRITVSINEMSVKGLKLTDVDVSKEDLANASIQIIKDAINNVSGTRADLGAVQNRLEHTIANLATTTENMTAAESRIRDTDMAKEMMTFTKNNVLAQAAQAMLAQANQQPQQVLQLLR